MPTKHQRIPVTKDEELETALARVRPLFPDTSAARIVHDLAVRGAAEVVREREQHEAAIERLIAFSHDPRTFVDLEVLTDVKRLAWGE